MNEMVTEMVSLTTSSPADPSGKRSTIGNGEIMCWLYRHSNIRLHNNGGLLNKSHYL